MESEDGESSPTRTRTLNLAVNSRSLYRLSYRGISSSSIPVRSAPLKGTRSTGMSSIGIELGTEPSRTGRAEAADDEAQSTARPAVAAGADQSAPAHSLCSRFLVHLDGLLEDADDQRIERCLVLFGPTRQLLVQAREACESGSGPRFQAWKHLLSSRKGPAPGISLSGTKPRSAFCTANRGMHWYCTRNSARTFIIFSEILRFEYGLASSFVPMNCDLTPLVHEPIPA